MKYFNNIPKIGYPDLVNENNYVAITNLLTRSAFLKEITDNTSIFYEYDVRDGETPEIIAHKLYGDANRFWIVLMFNTIKNPFYDFPLSSDALNAYIEAKYSTTVESALTTIHHYERRVTHSTLHNGTVQDSYTDVYTIDDQEQSELGDSVSDTGSLPGTADTYIAYTSVEEAFDNGVTVVTSYAHHAISIYQFELDENEKKRKINLLDKRYVPAVEQEFKKLMSK